MKALILVFVLAGAARADTLFSVQVGFDVEHGNFGAVESSTWQGMSVDVSAGRWLTDRVSLSAFIRARDTLGTQVGRHPTQEGWLGIRGEVAATPLLLVGAGLAAIAMGRGFDDQDFSTSFGLYAEAHVGLVIAMETFAIEPVIELGHIDVGGRAPSGSVYGRVGVGLRW